MRVLSEIVSLSEWPQSRVVEHYSGYLSSLAGSLAAVADAAVAVAVVVAVVAIVVCWHIAVPVSDWSFVFTTSVF